jgi:hypothetical protein
MSRPPPTSPGEDFPNLSWLTTMMSPPTRTLCECHPSRTPILPMTRGARGLATSMMVVPEVGRMWPT